MPQGYSAARKAMAALRVGDPNSAEYFEAVELVRGIRDTAATTPREGRVRHWSLPIGQISADFFCTAEHAERGWYGLLADTAGHGLPSAIFSLQIPTLFREAVQFGLSLPEIFERIHCALVRERSVSYFTCGLLVRIHERDIEIVNAGMPDGLLLAADGRLLDCFPSRHLPFGIEPTGTVSEQRHRLARDEEAALLLYSDGLIDLGAPVGDAFGEDGVRAAISGGASNAVDRLIDAVAASGHVAHDDISIVLIRAPLCATERAAEPVAGHAPLLTATEAALRIVDNFPSGLMLTDAEQRIMYVNSSFCTITGYSPQDAHGQRPGILGSGRHGPAFYRRMWRVLRRKNAWSGELWNRHKDGSLHLVWVDILALRDDSGTVTNFLASFTDITRKRQAEELRQHQALHDPLTDLAGRVLLADRGEQAMRRADRAERSLAVLFINLDRFNSINDSLGHDIGDEVLAAVADRLRGALRDDDTLSRFGGDEFVCLLPDIAQREDASRVAAKLLDTLENPIEIAGHAFKIGASIGISAYPSDARLLDDLVILASRAMTRAKQAGGNLFRFFSVEMSDAVERQLEMEARLDAAIRNGELELHYQPKIDLHDRRIVGAEALVRWRDPQRGLVPPAAFIPLAEKSDLIVKIGSWVLHQACADIARWQAVLPTDFHVAVNVSALQLERRDLAADVEAALSASSIDPARLQLEVTESLFIKDAVGAARSLRRIADLGVSLALDDFGTGYSNLGVLSQLPLDTFKLDQSFVRGVEGNRGNSAIAKAVWALADGMGKQVVAEGIETCDECRHVKSIGYRTGQGYRFGRPMAEVEFLAHLADWPAAHCSCRASDQIALLPDYPYHPQSIRNAQRPTLEIVAMVNGDPPRSAQNRD